MSEAQTQTRPARGRSSGRGGRGGFGRSSRGGNRQTNGDSVKDAVSFNAPEDEGEIGDMKRQYAPQLSTLKEFFPTWNELDLVMGLQETDGDLQDTIERITDGM
jgi:hypothetical protein